MRREEREGELSTYLTKKEEFYLKSIRKKQRKEQRIMIALALVLFFLTAIMLG